MSEREATHAGADPWPSPPRKEAVHAPAVLAPPTVARAIAIVCADDHLQVDFVDGRSLRVPIAQVPALAAADAEQRAEHRIIARGRWLEWPRIGLRVSVSALLDDGQGRRESLTRRLDRMLGTDGGAWLVGVVVPLLLLLWDPVVLVDRASMGATIVGDVKAFYVVSIALGLGSLAALMTVFRRSRFVAGLVLGASLAALALGVRLLPFSLFGMVFLGFGLLGLAPFLTARTMWLHAWRRLRERGDVGFPKTAVAGCVVFLATGLAIQWRAAEAVRTALDDLLSVDEAVRVEAVARLGRWRHLVDLDEVRRAWERERAPARKERLADAYFELTGTRVQPYD